MVQICGKIQAEFKPVTILQGHFSILTRDLSSKMGIGCGLLKQPCFMIPMSMYGSCYDIKGVKKNIQYILPILCQLYAFKWKLIFHTCICVKLHGALASKLLYFSHIHILQVVTRLRCFHIL